MPGEVGAVGGAEEHQAGEVAVSEPRSPPRTPEPGPLARSGRRPPTLAQKRPHRLARAPIRGRVEATPRVGERRAGDREHAAVAVERHLDAVVERGNAAVALLEEQVREPVAPSWSARRASGSPASVAESPSAPRWAATHPRAMATGSPSAGPLRVPSRRWITRGVPVSSSTSTTPCASEPTSAGSPGQRASSRSLWRSGGRCRASRGRALPPVRRTSGRGHRG